jgi:hypothetical protein
MVTNNFFAPPRAVAMEDAEECGETPSSDNNLDKGRPSPTALTSEVNLLSLQKDLKAVVTGEFFFRNTASGTRITIKSMADYRAIQSLLSQRGFPFFTFYIKGDKPVKAVIRHLPNNTSSSGPPGVGLRSHQGQADDGEIPFSVRRSYSCIPLPLPYHSGKKPVFSRYL